MDWRDAAVLVGVLTSTYALIQNSRALWQKTVGRRREFASRLRRIAPGMERGYLEQVLGLPAFKEAGNPIRLTWVDPDCYVQAIVDAHDVVQAMSFTTRTYGFAPRFFRGHTLNADGSTIEVKLGRTRFHDLALSPSGVTGSIGARRFLYGEAFDYGSPGYYVTYVYAVNDAGYIPSQIESLIGILQERSELKLGAFEPDGRARENIDEYLIDPKVERGRKARINTIGMTMPHADAKDALWATGPDLDLVRLLGREGWRANLRRHARGVKDRVLRRRP